MKRHSRRTVHILEAAIEGICRDAGLPCTDYDRLLDRFEDDPALDIRLSAPIGESLRNLLLVRRQVMTRAGMRP